MASNTIIEKYPLYNLGISGEEVERTLKNSAQKADVDVLQERINELKNSAQKADVDVLQERINKIKYYGDADIEISPDEWFVFNDEEHTVLGGFSEGHENETSIVIPYSVTTIAPEAFQGCRSLTSVTIPDSVTCIGDYAFGGCSSLESITIGNSVTSIGYDAFQGCSSLTSVTIPDSVTFIGSYAFQGCSSLTSVTIPDSVTFIGSYAFWQCSSLESITIGNSVTCIGDYAFGGCSSLESITIGNSVTSIGYDAFQGCSSLTSVTIPDSVTFIGSYAFMKCTSLTTISIPSRITSIGEYAFDDCTNLKIYCEQGSYAETYAQENNIPVKYTDVYIDKTIAEDSENAVSGGAVFDAVSEINNSVNEAVLIAKGRATGYAFDTLADLDAWLEDIDNMHRLVIGDNLYIRATDVPDYWWDGEQKQQLETQKVDLSEYYTKNEISTKIDEMSEIADESKSDSLQAISTSETANTTAQQAKANADNAIEIARSVRADADNGVFNGKDGADYIITEADKEEIKADVVEELTQSSTALPEVLDVNTIYDLGEQDALTLNLPSGKLGDFIEVDFLSTQTPTTLTITASSGMSDYELIPDANTIYSLYFNWIRLDVENYGWGFGYAEYTRTVTE